jgi:hypothetical protein
MLEAVGATVVWAPNGPAGPKFAYKIDPDRARVNVATAPKTGDGKPQLALSLALSPVKSG